MAKPNYTFEKRQKELAKKKKREEKRQKKQGQVSEESESDHSPIVGAPDTSPDKDT